jgi:hypothetical protein
VQACRAKRCESALPLEAAPEAIPARSGPFVRAQIIRDGRGPALSLVMSSVVRGEPYDLQVSYLAEAPVRGGRARFTLPARGRDPHLAPSSVQVSTRYRGQLEPEGALQLDSAFELPVSVRLQGGHVERATSSALCGRARCTRRFEARASQEARERPVWLLLDASPSMEGPARGRLEMALAALLEALPAQSPVRAIAFAAQAREIGSYHAATAPLATLGDALLADLGPGTRPSALLPVLGHEKSGPAPRLVLLSDARFDPAPREQRALEALTRRGSELWLVAVGDRAPAHSALFERTGGGVLQVAALADQSLRTGNLEPLSEALRVIASERRAGTRPGEQRVLESLPAKPFAPGDKPHWLALWALRGQESPLWLTRDSARDTSAIAAPAYASVSPPAPPADTGMPAQSVLDMLRTQLLPRARACLRSDRKGRGDYAVQVTFHALFAQREISDVRIEGAIQEPLRECLESVLSELRVPAFSGRIRVRYPIHTEREPDPPVIQLEPDVAAQVERVIHAPAPPPAPPRQPARAPVVK